MQVVGETSAPTDVDRRRIWITMLTHSKDRIRPFMLELRLRMSRLRSSSSSLRPGACSFPLASTIRVSTRKQCVRGLSVTEREMPRVLRSSQRRGYRDSNAIRLLYCLPAHTRQNRS